MHVCVCFVLGELVRAYLAARTSGNDLPRARRGCVSGCKHDVVHGLHGCNKLIVQHYTPVTCHRGDQSRAHTAAWQQLASSIFHTRVSHAQNVSCRLMVLRTCLFLSLSAMQWCSKTSAHSNLLLLCSATGSHPGMHRCPAAATDCMLR